MDARAKALEWLDKVEDGNLHAQLQALLDSGSESDVEDAFYCELSFGTAGLRGVLGPGTNRMNIYTVGRATQGLANYINATYSGSSTPCVAIARDSRHQGEEFVKRAACVLAANGIRAYLFPRIEPTPALSFAVRDLGCEAGICMTASHNPSSYNGYKAYGPDGCQITSEAASAISDAIGQIDPFTQVGSIDYNDAAAEGLICNIDDDTLERFLEAVEQCGVAGEEPGSETTLSVVYTPLCGTGLECMEHVFDFLSYVDVALVKTQSAPDGDFPTCEYPNPEERAALEEGIAECRKTGADLLLATDPDADRIGVAVKHRGDYVLPTGNEMGVLLFDYICKMRASAHSLPERPIVVSTIVSTAMIDPIAKDYGVEVKRTLTGFKYIGDIITSLEANGEEHRFLFGFEESYGYLAGTHVRDKDAISTGLLICEMAAYYAQAGKTLVDALDDLYQRYGRFANRTINIAFPGSDGSRKMAALMEGFRSEPPADIAGRNVLKVSDYAGGLEGLPKADVVEIELEGNAKVIFRPSGTEPKIKCYLFACETTDADSKATLDALERGSRDLIGK